MTQPAQPVCNCGSTDFNGRPMPVHQTTCPVYEPQLSYDEIRQLRNLLKYLRPEVK